ncbi:asparagine synthase (glutamine-hydrolyzing) [soil metagenome]
MCGIAGIILQPHTSLPDLHERLVGMAHGMAHRGPDDQGIYISPNGRVGLANRRLAIRDLSPAGHMPMLTEDEKVSITYNGEIYNTAELRSELEALGYRFRSQSDTEVILQGYVAWGKALVSRLRGMFAFAILDQRGAGTVLLARDHMGIKPLYYAQTTAGMLFASELKALLAAGMVSSEISAAGLVGYLQLGSVPVPLTIYRDIAALSPANLIEIDLARPQATPHCYWQLPIDLDEQVTYADAVEQVRAMLAEAVKIRLVSDVPLGAFLSGGLDSSAVVALMRQATNGPLRTCSMVFGEAAYSEASYAQAMAEHVGAEHYERTITAADLVAEFDNILAAMDQPSIDGVNSYFVSQTARQAGLTVALSGLGGDELFGGYPNTFGDVPKVYALMRQVQMLPGAASLAQAGIQHFYNGNGWQRLGDGLGEPASLANAYLTRRGLFSPSEVQALVHPDLWAEAAKTFDPIAHIAERADARPSKSVNRQSQMAWVSRAELRTYTHHQLLRDTDVMSMIHSLEVRVPLLDRKLVTLVLRLPAAIKTNHLPYPKPLLVAAVGDYLPKVVAERKDKMGFTFPFAPWLRDTLQTQTQARLAETEQMGLLQPAMVKRIEQKFQTGQIHWSRLWALLALGAISPKHTLAKHDNSYQFSTHTNYKV